MIPKGASEATPDWPFDPPGPPVQVHISVFLPSGGSPASSVLFFSFLSFALKHACQEPQKWSPRAIPKRPRIGLLIPPGPQYKCISQCFCLPAALLPLSSFF